MGPNQPNPYAPPQAPIQPGGYALAGGPTCPRCQSPNVHRPAFTWWGGVLGPKLFNHMQCRNCNFGFNAKSGKSNGPAIAIYMGVGVAIALALVALRLLA